MSRDWNSRLVAFWNVPTAIAVTSVTGFLVGCLGYVLGVDFATHAGFGLAAGSLLFALLGSIVQGRLITRINDQVHRVLFNDVTMRVFYNIQENEKLSQRMHEGNVELKNALGPALWSLRINGGESDVAVHSTRISFRSKLLEAT